MAITLALTSPTAVNRSASTNWTSIANVTATPPTYTSSGTYAPGNLSWFIRLVIAAPASPVAILPPTVQVALTGHRATLTSATEVVIDTVGIGVSSSTNNAANNELLGFSDSVFNYNVSTSGLALSDFNAGNLHLWLGVKAVPTSAFVGGDFSLSTSPVNQTLTQNGPATLAQAYTTTVNYIGTPPGPSYVVLSVDSFAQGEGTPIIPPTANYGGTASADDGQGGVDAGVIQNPAGLPNPPASRASTTTASHAVTLTLGSGSLVITPVCTVSATPTATVNSLCQTGINSVTVVPPDPATAFLAGATLSYIPIVPLGESSIIPPFAYPSSM